jgi:hypothetical protein
MTGDSAKGDAAARECYRVRKRRQYSSPEVRITHMLKLLLPAAYLDKAEDKSTCTGHEYT